MEELLDLSRSWVREHAGGSTEHLLRGEAWLRRLHPSAPQAMLLATLTHDMERAFPGPDSPRQDPARGPDDPVYLEAHQERSARIVTDFLQEKQVSHTLVDEVARLIRVHEVGG